MMRHKCYDIVKAYVEIESISGGRISVFVCNIIQLDSSRLIRNDFDQNTLVMSVDLSLTM